MDVEAPAAHGNVGLPPIVKGYVDLLTGAVVADDSDLEHLIVLRRPGTEAIVTLRCTPITVLTEDYDRAFRIASEVEGLPDGAPARVVDAQPVSVDPTTWGLHDFGQTDRELLHYDEYILSLIDDIDSEVAEQEAEDPDAPVDLDLQGSEAEFADESVRDGARAALEPRVAAARGHWLANQALGARDRPGPAPAWLDEVRDRDVADILEVDDSTPGCFVLPAPTTVVGTSNAWAAQATQIFAQRMPSRSGAGPGFPVRSRSTSRCVAAPRLQGHR